MSNSAAVLKAPSIPARGVSVIFGTTIFLSAFLLFQVQLILAKYILPWFGGVPAVWTVCMLFFQVSLLAGYAYAHWLVGRKTLHEQRAIHVAVLAVSLVPIILVAWSGGSPLLPGENWKPVDATSPEWQIIVILGLSVGLPFFVLSSTNPLLQHWLSAHYGDAAPYRYYSLSNVGSLLGLLSYPVLFEVWLSLTAQAWLWAGAYTAFLIGIVRCSTGTGSPEPPATTHANSTPVRPDAALYILWFGLAACASIVLLATTNQIGHEIAVIPFLWILPLVLYLLSFILCFGNSRWYSRPVYVSLLIPVLSITTLLLSPGAHTTVLAQILIYSMVVFVVSMVCHGELANLKPHPAHLTRFYFTLTLGGATGGLFVGLLAPRLFQGYWELGIGLWLSSLLLFAVLLRDRSFVFRRGGATPVVVTLAAATGMAVVVVIERYKLAVDISFALSGLLQPFLLLGAGVLLLIGIYLYSHRPVVSKDSPIKPGSNSLAVASAVAALAMFAITHVAIGFHPLEDTLSVSRNFYGVLTVTDEDRSYPDRHVNTLYHGSVVHGLQYRSQSRRSKPTTYYIEESGVGLLLDNHPQRQQGGKLRVGVIGLGVGTLATYGKAGDDFRFYEVDPAVGELTFSERGPFTYVRDTLAKTSLVLGDARVSLERELQRGERQQFNVLVLDAFTNGSIPVHLLTREAFEIYLQHLDPDKGVLAVHISNAHIDLEPVLWRLSEHFNLTYYVVNTGRRFGIDSPSHWVLLSPDIEVLNFPAIAAHASMQAPKTRGSLWTDSYSNLLQITRFLGEASAEDDDGDCVGKECPESSHFQEFMQF